MKTILTVAIIAAVLVAAAVWAMAGSKPAGSACQVEVRDVAGAARLSVVPDVVAAVPGHYVMPEVVVTSNMMPEVVVHARFTPEVAATPLRGIELAD
jgi:hypothetical protein